MQTQRFSSSVYVCVLVHIREYVYIGLHKYIKAPEDMSARIQTQRFWVCVCVCVLVHIYVCVYKCIHLSTYIHIGARRRERSDTDAVVLCVSIHTYICVYKSISIYIYTYTYIHIDAQDVRAGIQTQVSVGACMWWRACVCSYLQRCVCMYIYLHIGAQRGERSGSDVSLL